MTTLAPPIAEATTPVITTAYNVLRQAAGIIDYSGAGLFEITGRGAGSLISKITTRSVDFLLEDQSQQALILDPNGLVISDLVVHGLGDGFLLQVWPDQAAAVRSLLIEATASNSDVELVDISTECSVIGVEGPTSFAVVGHYLDFPISSLAYKSGTKTSWQGHDLLVSRTGVTGEFGYVLIGPASVTEELRADLIGHGAEPVNRAAVDICRLEMRFPNLEAELPPAGATPFHLGLPWLVDFSGDFIGKDALLGDEEGPVRPVCWQSHVGDRAVPAAGTMVEVSDATVGAVLQAVYSPTLDRCIGTALVDSGCAAAGLSFLIAGNQVDTVSAPFLIGTSFTTTMD